MQLKLLEEAIFEAKRFLKKAEECKKRFKSDDYAKYKCKEAGSAKRASLDLSRTLSKMRNNN